VNQEEMKERTKNFAIRVINYAESCQRHEKVVSSGIRYSVLELLLVQIIVPPAEVPERNI